MRAFSLVFVWGGGVSFGTCVGSSMAGPLVHSWTDYMYTHPPIPTKPTQFNDYMKQYLKANPEYSQYDYPSFEEFDRNGCACVWLWISGEGRVRRRVDALMLNLKGCGVD